ncbi:MAG: hypothetical protein GY953_47675, partial [bacterium]|nr:hypothetical protein [bacterium]
MRIPATLLMAGLLACNGSDSTPTREPEVRIRLALQPSPANKVWEAAELVRRELERRSNGR